MKIWNLSKSTNIEWLKNKNGLKYILERSWLNERSVWEIFITNKNKQNKTEEEYRELAKEHFLLTFRNFRTH